MSKNSLNSCTLTRDESIDTTLEVHLEKIIYK